ncbi:ABC transporter substrate-binding protein [Marinomonas fungiae]|uniref:ABC-type Fe3+ transport system, periplasmic component n=1 Tax=Marinomonas fungiae TaxID=1137284 RepID=A0A0K6IGL5_9GAMM|nr:ABC transporter substrate-binding protein [Marinomonas fungiae]CUB02176.1 ABC-type Fe3+ transport system, periplasmic component [Marinomonas fungiae]
MKGLVAFFCLYWSVWGSAATPVWFGDRAAPRVLFINSTLDMTSFQPLLERFVALYPDVRIGYVDVNTLELYYRTVSEVNRPTASLILSSAMDLQLKLVNDGFTQAYRSDETSRLAKRAKWRDEVFAFSYEPVVMMVNKNAFVGGQLPEDRQSLLSYIRQNDEQVAGRMGTYDIRTSGVGYLLASQDARQADATWGRLLEAFGSHGVKTYCCSSDIIDDVASGELLVGYNLLGSYAAQRANEDPNLEMIIPKDYTLMLMRTAVIPKHAANPQDAGRFLDFLLSDEGQTLMTSEELLYPIRPNLNDAHFAMPLGPTRTIRTVDLDQQLLVGRDLVKQRRFIRNWELALELSSDD